MSGDENSHNTLEKIFKNHPRLWAITTVIAVLAIIVPIVYEDASRPQLSPKAQITATVKEGHVPLAVSFYSVNSSDPKGSQLTYQWFINDKSVSSATELHYTFKNPDNYMVKLVVTNEKNISDQQGIVIKALLRKLSKEPLPEVDKRPIEPITPVPKSYQLTDGNSIHIEGFGSISVHFEAIEGEAYVVLSSKHEKKILYNPGVVTFNGADNTLYLRATKIDENRQIVYFLIE